MALLALSLHGSAATGDAIEGSDVDIFGVCEPGDSIADLAAQVGRSGVLDAWDAERVEMAILPVDELNPLWVQVALTADLIDGERPDLPAPDPVDWVLTAWAQAGACLALEDRPVQAALFAAVSRAVAAGAPIPTTPKGTWPDLYRDAIGGEWSDVLDRLARERRDPSEEARRLALEFLDGAGDHEFRERARQQLLSISDRTFGENLAADPRGSRFEVVHGALTPAECDRALRFAADHRPGAGRFMADYFRADGPSVVEGGDDSVWLTERLFEVMTEVNDRTWRYGLVDATAGVPQLPRPGTRMPWHLDVYPRRVDAQAVRGRARFGPRRLHRRPVAGPTRRPARNGPPRTRVGVRRSVVAPTPSHPSQDRSTMDRRHARSGTPVALTDEPFAPARRATPVPPRAAELMTFASLQSDAYDVLDFLADLTRRPAWMADALCREPKYRDVNWFPERGADVRLARSVCAACAARTDCLAYGLDNVWSGSPHGIWGGLSANQIRQALSDGATGADAADLIRWYGRPKPEPAPKRPSTDVHLEVDPIYCAGCGQPKPVDEFSTARRYCGNACKDAAKRVA